MEFVYRGAILSTMRDGAVVARQPHKLKVVSSNLTLRNQYARLDKRVKSLALQARDRGFESHSGYVRRRPHLLVVRMDMVGRSLT